jgi:hypothetical protein
LVQQYYFIISLRNWANQPAGRQGPNASLPTKQILEIGIQIAEGLAAAHESSVSKPLKVVVNWKDLINEK